LGDGGDMQSLMDILIKKTLQKSGAGIVFASLFGSYRRGDYDAFSDIDIFIVHEEEDEKSQISNRLKRLERTLNRGIHVNLLSFKEFENRLRLRDYLLASIIEDSSFVLGKKDVFSKAKLDIREVRPDEESIRFNRQMGFKTLEHVYSFIDGLNSVNPSHHRDMVDYAVKSLNDYRLALGYLYASAQMQIFGRNVVSARLMQNNVSSILKRIACIEKTVKRGSKIDYAGLRKLVDGIKNKSLRILTINESSPSRLIPLIKSYHMDPLLEAI